VAAAPDEQDRLQYEQPGRLAAAFHGRLDEPPEPL
jgi:hypothetical protein